MADVIWNDGVEAALGVAPRGLLRGRWDFSAARAEAASLKAMSLSDIAGALAAPTLASHRRTRLMAEVTRRQAAWEAARRRRALLWTLRNPLASRAPARR